MGLFSWMKEQRLEAERFFPNRGELLGALALWGIFAFLRSFSPIYFPDAAHKLTLSPWLWRLGKAALDYGIWLLLTPFAVYLARRFPLRGPSVIRNLVIHAISAILFTIAYIVLRTVIDPPIYGQTQFSPLHTLVTDPKKVFINNYVQSASVFALIVAISTILDLQRGIAQMETHLMAAQLSTLKMQLQPHFLFNTLNSISSLIDWKPDDARAMLVQLADLMRMSLDVDRAIQIPLGRELDWIEEYLALQRMRFGSRLATEIIVAEDILGAAVPPMILQPLVENAFKHGFSASVARIQIAVEARRYHNSLQLIVRDNGPGLEASASFGVGLRNTRERLATLYGRAASVTLRPGSGGGCEAMVNLPFVETALD